MSAPTYAYPGDLTDAERAILAPLIPAAKPGGRPRKWHMRAVLNGIFYLLRARNRSGSARPARRSATPR